MVWYVAVITVLHLFGLLVNLGTIATTEKYPRVKTSQTTAGEDIISAMLLMAVLTWGVILLAIELRS